MRSKWHKMDFNENMLSKSSNLKQMKKTKMNPKQDKAKQNQTKSIVFVYIDFYY